MLFLVVVEGWEVEFRNIPLKRLPRPPALPPPLPSTVGRFAVKFRGTEAKHSPGGGHYARQRMTRILGLLRPCSDLFPPSSLAGGGGGGGEVPDFQTSALCPRRSEISPWRSTTWGRPGLKSYFFNIEADRHSCSLVVDSIRGKRRRPPSSRGRLRKP